MKKPTQRTPSPFDPAKLRDAYLSEFDEILGEKFSKLWELLQGKAERHLRPNMTREDVALAVAEVANLYYHRYNQSSFQADQALLKSSGYKHVSGKSSYFDVVKEGIDAATLITEQLDILIESLSTLDVKHIECFMSLLASECFTPSYITPPNDWVELLRTLTQVRYIVNSCAASLIAATGQSPTERRKRGHPRLSYEPIATEAMTLWTIFTGKTVVTARDLTSDRKSKKQTTVRQQSIRSESGQPSTQFIHLVLQMIVPNIKLKETETTINNVLRIRKDVISEGVQDMDLKQRLFWVQERDKKNRALARERAARGKMLRPSGK